MQEKTFYASWINSLENHYWKRLVFKVVLPIPNLTLLEN